LTGIQCKTLVLTPRAAHCNTLQHTATHHIGVGQPSIDGDLVQDARFDAARPLTFSISPPLPKGLYLDVCSGLIRGKALHTSNVSAWFTVSMRCNALQRTATHYNALQRTATHCNTLQRTATHCSALQRTAAHCNALQRTATHCNALQRTAIPFITLQCTAICCNTLHRTATHSSNNALQYTAMHCNTLQRTATYCNTMQRTPVTSLSDFLPVDS